MTDDERRERGVAMRRRILGDAHVERAMSTPNRESLEFQDFLTRYVWGEIWTREGLDQRTRRVLVLGTLIALGRWEELALHVKAAIAEGAFTRQDLAEIVLQQAVYCGIPTAHRAHKIIEDALPPGSGLS